MNMTRRSFLKSLAAIAVVPVIAQIPEWIDAPVTANDPLAWLYLSDSRFPLIDFSLDQYRYPPARGEGGVLIPTTPAWRWISECTIAGDVLNELSEIASVGDRVAMRIELPSSPTVFTGLVRASRTSMTGGINRETTSAILLFGSGTLTVEGVLT